MGGNNSRHGNGGEVLPGRIRHRIEEWRKRRSATTLQREEEGTFSNKNLQDDGKSQSSEENENRNNNKGSPNDTQQAKQGVEKISKVVPFSGIERQRNELHIEEKRKGEVVELKTEKVKSIRSQTEIKHEEENAKHGSGDDDDDDDDDEEEDDEDDDIESGRLIGPASPSFKVYCNETKSKYEESFKVYCNETKNKLEEELHESKALGNENITVVHLKTPSASSVESSASAASDNSRNFNEVVEMAPIPKRKGKKKKKFSVMKKNILHVKHLNRMNPVFACTGSDRRRLLEDK